MARAALNWSGGELAEAAGISRPTVARFEMGSAVAADSIEAMRKALEAAGVRFLMNGPHRGAVVPPGAAMTDKSGENPLLRR